MILAVVIILVGTILFLQAREDIRHGNYKKMRAGEMYTG